MDKTLVISDAQSRILLDFYLNKIEEINSIIAPLLSEKMEFEDLVKQLNGGIANSAPLHPESKAISENLLNDTKSGYDPTWSIPRKGLFILSKERHDLSTSEVFDKLLVYEPSLASRRGLTMVLISSGFKDKTGKVLYRTGKKRGEFKYGLLEWKKSKG